jgi:hypothetical protein
MNTVLAAPGTKLKVEFAADDDGASALRDLYLGLRKTDRAALGAAFEMLAERGRVPNAERFKKVEGTDLWEFKKHQHRFVGFYLKGGRFIIAAYEQKKRGRLRDQTISRAEEVRAAMIEVPQEVRR